MKKYFLFLLIVLASGSLTGQNLYELYKDYLPEGHLKVYTKTTINQQLNSDALVDPSLIYLRIFYYNNVVSKKDSLSETNGRNRIKNAYVKKNLEKNQWTNQQLEILKENSENIKYYSRTVSSFKTLLVTQKDESFKVRDELVYDKNLDFYFRYLYFKKDPQLKYDDNLDYVQLCRQEKIKIVEEIKNESEEIKKELSNDIDPLVDKILYNWNIMSECAQLLPSMEILLGEVKDFSSYKKSDKLFTFQFGNFSTVGNREVEMRSSDIPQIENKFLINPAFGLAKQKKLSAISLSFKYKYDLPKSISFSHVTAGLTFSYIRSEFNDKAYDSRGEYTRRYNFKNENEYNYTLSYMHEISINLLSGYNLQLSLSTPLLFFTKDITLDAGFITSYQFCRYMWAIRYSFQDYKYVKPEHTIISSEYNQLMSNTTTLHKINIYPLVSLNVNLFDFLAWNVYYNLEGVGFNFGVLF